MLSKSLVFTKQEDYPMNKKLLLLSPILVLTHAFQTLECKQQADNHEFDSFWQDFDQTFDQMRHEVKEIIDKAFAHFEEEGAFNLKHKLQSEEKDGNLILHITLPNIEPQSLNVAIDDTILKVTGSQVKEIKSDKQNGPTKITKKQFQLIRTLPYPVNAETTKAEYENNVLTITMHKEKPKNAIPVTVK